MSPLPTAYSKGRRRDWEEGGTKNYSCPTGMPEEMMTVYNAIKRNYAVVAIGPHRSGDLYGCFNTTWPPKGYHELPDVRALKHARYLVHVFQSDIILVL